MVHDGSAREQEVAVLKEVQRLEPELKSALYAAYELAGATKAALYLIPSYTSDHYEIVTSYAFNPSNRKRIDNKDPLVQRLWSTHAPVVVNAMADDDVVAEVLFRHNHQRLLAVPFFGRGRRMIGFLDLRDKTGRKNFVASDVAAAEGIMGDIALILGSRNLYALGRVPLVEMAWKSDESSPDAWSAPRLPIKKTQTEPAGSLSTQAIEVIRLAHDRMTHRDLSIDRRRRILTEEEFDRVGALVPSALAIPGVVAAVLTGMSQHERQTIFSHGEPTPDAVKLIRDQIAKWAGRATNDAASVSVVNLSRAPGALTVDQLRSVASCPLAPRAVEQLMLTIALEKQPDDTSRQQIERFADVLGDSVEAIIGRIELQRERFAMAERLLEPDFNRYEGLADHSRLVSNIAYRFAAVVGLASHDAETVRIAGLIHDVGLRLLDYQELTSSKDLSGDHKRAVTEHPLVGAALVEPILGSEVALAVLRHHERIDGTGYPGRVPGSRIPITAKIVAIADAWVAMTSPWAYVKCVPPGDAVKRLREGAGTQFDPQLVETFLAARDEIVGSDDEM